MRKFYCTAYKNLRMTSKGRVFQFENSFLEVDESEEDLIAELEGNPFIVDADAVVIDIKEGTKEEAKNPEDALLYYKLANRITIEDAKRYADERGIEYPEDVVKQELIDAINEAQSEKIK